MLVGLVFVAAFVLAGAEERTVERIKAQAPNVKRWGGWILVAVGTWFLLLALFAGFFERVFPV